MISLMEPNWEGIKNLKTSLQPGELALLERIVDYLSNLKHREFEIYIQPYINGLRSLTWDKKDRKLVVFLPQISINH